MHWDYQGLDDYPIDGEERACVICGVTIPPATRYCGASCEQQDTEPEPPLKASAEPR